MNRAVVESEFIAVLALIDNIKFKGALWNWFWQDDKEQAYRNAWYHYLGVEDWTL